MGFDLIFVWRIKAAQGDFHSCQSLEEDRVRRSTGACKSDPDNRPCGKADCDGERMRRAAHIILRLSASAAIALMSLATATAGSMRLPVVLAQAGSAGGTIGKRDKSVSGGEEAAPTRQSVTSKPRQAKRAVPPDAGYRRAHAGVSLGGRWRWIANCERGVRHFNGVLTFETSGSTFSATHGGTNFFDSGTITNGRISGNRVSFTRTWGPYVDHLNLVLAGSRMSGVLPNTAYSGRCQVSATKA